METPLDVLSRAASIVDIRESVTAVAPSAGIKHSMEGSKMDDTSPPDPALLDIPTKFHKYRRLKEQQEKTSGVATGNKRGPSEAGLMDLTHQHGDAACHSKKCAGTQTSFSSFNPSDHPPPAYPQQRTPPLGALHIDPKNVPPFQPDNHGNNNNNTGLHTNNNTYSFTARLDHGAHNSNHGNHHRLSPDSSPPPPLMELDPSNMPLNLTVSSSNSSASGSVTPPPSQSRPFLASSHTSAIGIRDSGVIANSSKSTTYAAATHVFRPSVISHLPPGGATASSTPPPPHGVAVTLPLSLTAPAHLQALPPHPGAKDNFSSGLCDSEIEEHFQRSLGKHYQSHTTASQSINIQAPPNTAVTMATPVTMATSSHQAKVVVQKVPAGSAAGSVDDHFAKSLGETWTKIKEKNDPMNIDGMWSVDDHFAKALGDTWFKIKKARENGECSSGESSPREDCVMYKARSPSNPSPKLQS